MVPSAILGLTSFPPPFLGKQQSLKTHPKLSWKLYALGIVTNQLDGCELTDDCEVGRDSTLGLLGPLRA